MSVVLTCQECGKAIQPEQEHTCNSKTATAAVVTDVGSDILEGISTVLDVAGGAIGSVADVAGDVLSAAAEVAGAVISAAVSD